MYVSALNLGMIAAYYYASLKFHFLFNVSHVEQM